ncbi:MAG TPA: sigma 54-interacting transcriptional regulator [Candidatus Competibacteraceae bacterium]|nr:sigma 54-interacting transcriptional regulator [Candidatus Competibacteraceae bacterium]
MEIKAWLFYFGQRGDEIKNRMLESLEHRGISIYLLDPERPGSLGILIFDEISHQLCDFLRDVDRKGLGRMLAIATSPAALADRGAWRLLQAGASEVLVWHHSSDPADQIVARLQRWAAVDQLLKSPLVQNNLIGQSRAWKSVLRQVIEVARFTDASVLIMGESGTGKELVARLIHTLDSRREKRDLVVLDCTTIVPELSGSEFFGHERGAFTGAMTPRDGAFALADDGTLFLDEVGELLPGLQAQLLRVIQERHYRRVGGNTWHHTDFRLICATNRDLMQEVHAGKFRSDLYYRIATWVFRLPPLHERPEDVLPLAHHFLKELRSDKESPELDEAVKDYLLRRDYPGNVRDLKQLVLRISHRHVGDGPITVGDIPEEDRPKDLLPADWCDARFDQAIRRALALGFSLKEISQGATETAIRIAVTDEEGNLQRAARKLGVTDRALQMRRANRRQYGQM